MDDKITIDLSDLFLELGLENIAQEEKQKIADMLYENVINRIKLHLVDNLPAEDLAYLDTVADNPTLTVEFLVNKPEINFSELLIAATQECREEFIKDANYAQGMLDATMKKAEEN
jgi:hypothetical protein